MCGPSDSAALTIGLLFSFRLRMRTVAAQYIASFLAPESGSHLAFTSHGDSTT